MASYSRFVQPSWPCCQWWYCWRGLFPTVHEGRPHHCRHHAVWLGLPGGKIWCSKCISHCASSSGRSAAIGHEIAWSIPRGHGPSFWCQVSPLYLHLHTRLMMSPFWCITRTTSTLLVPLALLFVNTIWRGLLTASQSLATQTNWKGRLHAWLSLALNWIR